MPPMLRMGRVQVSARPASKRVKLPKPAHKYGYTHEQLQKIKRKAGITDEQFSEAFGANTCVHDEKLGTIFYKCDIERALWKLGKGGKAHAWD